MSNEPLVNRQFHDLDELEEVQAQRCVVLQDAPDLIRSHTSFRLRASPQRKTLVIIRKWYDICWEDPREADAEYDHVLLATGTGEVRAELMHEYEAAPFGTRIRSHFHLPQEAPGEIVKALYEHNKQEMQYFATFLPDLYRSETGG